MGSPKAINRRRCAYVLGYKQSQVAVYKMVVPFYFGAPWRCSPILAIPIFLQQKGSSLFAYGFHPHEESSQPSTFSLMAELATKCQSSQNFSRLYRGITWNGFIVSENAMTHEDNVGLCSTPRERVELFFRVLKNASKLFID